MAVRSVLRTGGPRKLHVRPEADASHTPLRVEVGARPGSDAGCVTAGRSMEGR